MIGQEVVIPTQDGEMNTLVFRPVGSAPLPAVILFMPSTGINEELCGLARRLARGGYLVLLPNLYYRHVRVVDIDANRLKEPAYEPIATMMVKLSRALTNDLVARDTAALLRFIETLPMARRDRVGSLGYCMGGRLALTAIGTFPERIQAAASLYGGKLITDYADSPHLKADRISGELYFGFAENDEYVPRRDVERLDDYLSRSGVNHTVEIFPRTGHGFTFPLRHAYQESGAEMSWQRLSGLFARALKA